MAWVKNDFECRECGVVFEELYKRSEEAAVVCIDCGSNNIAKLLCAPALQTFSIMSPDQKRQHLLKRSAKHTQQQLDKEPEKYGAQGIERRTKKIQG